MSEAYGYCRVSSVGQLNGTGIDRQEDVIAAYARKNDIELVNMYRDAHTGTEEDRPAFIDMLAAMMSNGVKVVIVESLDRLARDLTIQLSLLAKLASEGLTLISATTGEDVTQSMRDDPMRRALVQIQGVFAELEKRLLVRKLRKGREATKAITGRCEGVKPYGTKDGEQETRQWIDAMHKDGLNPSAIAEALNAAGRLTRKGKPWKRGTIWAMLRSAG